MSLWTVVRTWAPRVIAGLACISVVATALWWAVGIIGVAIAIAVAAVWVVAPTVYAVATGGLLFAILAGDGSTPELLAAGSFLALFGVDLLDAWPVRTAGLAVGTLVGATAILSTVYVVDSLWLSGIALLSGFAVVAYALHRYELVRLELLTGVEP